jgi:hypothetical protein
MLSIAARSFLDECNEHNHDLRMDSGPWDKIIAAVRRRLRAPALGRLQIQDSDESG